MSKKQKGAFLAAAVIVVLAVAFYMWGNDRYSPEHTAGQFIAALESGDIGTVSEMVTVDGETVSNEEAEAVIALSEDPDYFTYSVDDDPAAVINETPVFNVESSGSALLIFTDYRIEAEPQYVRVIDEADIGLETTFNGLVFPAADSGAGYTEYGPMAPGVYTVTDIYDTAFGAVDATEERALIHGDNEYYSEALVTDVTLQLENREGLPYESIELYINDTVVDGDFEDDTVALGYIPLDGSLILNGEIETAWGAVEVDPVPLTEAEQIIELNLVTDTLEDMMAEVTVGFGEDFVQALAAQDASEIEGITDGLRDDINNEWFSEKDDVGFTGQLDAVGISFENTEPAGGEYEYEIPVHLQMTGYYDGQDEGEYGMSMVIQLRFDTESERWEVTGFRPEPYFDYNYNIYEGSGERVEGIENEDAQSEDDDSGEDSVEESEIGDLVEDYVNDLARAVNDGDYSIVSSHIASDSDFEDMQSGLVDRQSEADLTQTIESVDVENVSESGDDTWEVETVEVIELNYADGDTVTETFNWTYTVELMDGELQITGLE